MYSSNLISICHLQNVCDKHGQEFLHVSVQWEKKSSLLKPLAFNGS